MFNMVQISIPTEFKFWHTGKLFRHYMDNLACVNSSRVLSSYRARQTAILAVLVLICLRTVALLTIPALSADEFRRLLLYDPMLYLQLPARPYNAIMLLLALDVTYYQYGLHQMGQGSRFICLLWHILFARIAKGKRNKTFNKQEDQKLQFVSAVRALVHMYIRAVSYFVLYAGNNRFSSHLWVSIRCIHPF